MFHILETTFMTTLANSHQVLQIKDTLIYMIQYIKHEAFMNSVIV